MTWWVCFGCYVFLTRRTPVDVIDKDNLYCGRRQLPIYDIYYEILLDFSRTVKSATLIFISGCGSAISSSKEGKSGFIYNFVKS